MIRFLPIVAIVIALVGIVKSVGRRVRFMTDSRYRGWIDVSSIPARRLEPMFFCVEYRGVEYYTFTRMYMPKRIGFLYMNEVKRRIGGNYRAELKGGYISVEYSVPGEYTVSCSNGYVMIKEMNQFDTYLKRSGVKRSTLVAVMNEYRRALYREMVKDGQLKESELQ